MRIQTEYNSYDFQAHQQRSQRRCCCYQTALLWFEVLQDMSPALPGWSPALLGACRLVVCAPSYSEGRQGCSPMVWYSPEIGASKFTLHILTDTPGGFQWLKYIVLMFIGKRYTVQLLPPEENELQLGVNDVWLCIVGYLNGNVWQ
jgi:hypothetical protein